MNRIDQVFAQNKKVFIPYITAGFPSVDETLEILHVLADNGAGIVELGFPFSDPTADGPTIQESSQQALQRGFRRPDYFEIIRRFREKNDHTPLVAFSYFNPVFDFGVERFVEELANVGADAVLMVDVPLEEQDEIIPALRKHGLYLIQLVAPTTPDERVERLLQNAGGFVYQIALKGVTGARDALPEDWRGHVERLRKFTQLPVCLGFGVSHGNMAREVAKVADGVIVGSALVRKIAENEQNWREPLTDFTRELAEAIHTLN